MGARPHRHVSHHTRRPMPPRQSSGNLFASHPPSPPAWSRGIRKSCLGHADLDTSSRTLPCPTRLRPDGSLLPPAPGAESRSHGDAPSRWSSLPQRASRVVGPRSCLPHTWVLRWQVRPLSFHSPAHLAVARTTHELAAWCTCTSSPLEAAHSFKPGSRCSRYTRAEYRVMDLAVGFFVRSRFPQP